MQRRCCCPPERKVPRLVSEPFTSSHSDTLRRLRSVFFAFAQADAVEDVSGQHVVVDAHRGERVRALEHHADFAAHRVGLLLHDVHAVEHDFPRHLDVLVEFVHAVHGAEQGALAASRRPHDGSDGVALHGGRHILHGRYFLVIRDADVFDF